MKWYVFLGCLIGAVTIVRAQTMPIPQMGKLGLSYTTLSPSEYGTMLVLHSKGGSIAVVPRLSADECKYWAQRLTPQPKTNIENYTIVSGECFQ